MKQKRPSLNKTHLYPCSYHKSSPCETPQGPFSFQHPYILVHGRPTQPTQSCKLSHIDLSCHIRWVVLVKNHGDIFLGGGASADAFPLSNGIQGKSSTRAKNKYNANNYDSLRIVVPKGRKTEIEAFAASQEESVNGLVNKLLRQAMSKSEEEWKRTTEDTRGT